MNELLIHVGIYC